MSSQAAAPHVEHSTSDCLLHCYHAAGTTQAATCLALLACCRTVNGAAAMLAGPAGSQAMAALLCNHQRQVQQVRPAGAIAMVLCRGCHA